MLSNTIGTVLAFLTIMLLLSLVVTGFVQATQSLLRLRFRNLLVGVAELVKTLSDEMGHDVKSTQSRFRSNQKVVAAEILNRPSVSALKQVNNPNSPQRLLIGQPVLWADKVDLAQAVAEHFAEDLIRTRGGLPAVTNDAPNTTTGNNEATPNIVQSISDQVEQHFDRLEPKLSDRFALIIRLWTLFWALVVAILFQVNTPDLLKNLATSETKREAILAMTPKLTAAVEQSGNINPFEDDFADRLLTQLGKEFPAHQDFFDQVSGDSFSKEQMIKALEDVLAEDPDRGKIVDRYAVLIDNEAKGDLQTALTKTYDAIDTLAIIDITPWRKQLPFYAEVRPLRIHWNNVFGVLFTAILLSFGAPFWFEQLKNVASLRDTLARTQKQ